MQRRRSRSGLPWITMALFVSVVGGGLFVLWHFRSVPATAAKPALATDEDLSNNRFTPPPADPNLAPVLVNIPLPNDPGPGAIWGSTGRDARGHIWIGVSTFPSAQLLEYMPETGQIVDRGFVLEKLNDVRPLKPHESQAKIHTRIVQGQDGWLYFASSDEVGENDDGSKPPTWGSHIWRMNPLDGKWEHLLAVPEGLIALAGFGSVVYALGYWDHVLYQFDCATGKTASVHVKSIGGHVSRNLICDHRGHVYVPRLRYTGTSPPKLGITLVEFDPTLRQIGESRLSNYAEDNLDESHGIVGVQAMADQSIFFVTHLGYLYRIIPSNVGAALVLPLGSIHPQGRSYTASLFSFDGKRHLMGASRRLFDGGTNYEWVVYDVEGGTSKAFPLKVPVVNGENVLLYGSQTRDNLGDFYLVGTDGHERRNLPLIFRVVVGGGGM